MTREGGLGKLDLPLSPSPTEPWEGALGFGRLEKGRGCLPETAAVAMETSYNLGSPERHCFPGMLRAGRVAGSPASCWCEE